MLPSPVSDVAVVERQSNKLTLSWSPGHDGFSPLTKCHIRVSLTSAQTELSLNVLRQILTCSLVCPRLKRWVGRKGRWRPPDSSTSQCRLSIVKSLGCRLWRGTTWVFPAAMRWEPLLSPCGSKATPQREVCEYLRMNSAGWILLAVGNKPTDLGCSCNQSKAHTHVSGCLNSEGWDCIWLKNHLCI